MPVVTSARAGTARTGDQRWRRAGTVALPPWTRAPWLGLRHPAVVLAVAGAALILACTAASAPLFLSSAGSGALARGISEKCPGAANPTVALDTVAALPAGQDGRVRAAFTSAGLPAPHAMLHSGGQVEFGADDAAFMTLLYRDGAEAELTVLARTGGGGVLLPDDVTGHYGIRPGDTVRLGRDPVPVAGVYRNFYQAGVRPFWCDVRELFVLDNPDVAPPPVAVFTDAALLERAVRGNVAGSATGSGGRAEQITYFYASPVHTADLTVTGAHDTLERWERARAAVVAGLPGDGGVNVLGVKDSPFEGQQDELAPITERATAIRDGLSGPVLPIALGGAALALLLVGAAGSYWADRRRREIALLSSRGVGPVGLAAKALLELAVPAVAGTVLGYLLARQLVARLGPSDDLDPGAPGQAAATAATGLAAGLVMLALVAGLRARRATERPQGRRRSRWVLVPWELGLVGLSAWAYAELRSGSGIDVVDRVAQVDLLLMAFPLLFLVGTALFMVRVATALLGPLRSRAGRWPVPLYLAVSRITGAPVASMLLLAALAMPVAMVVYSSGVTSTVDTTVRAKVGVFLGADASVSTVDPLEATPELDRVGTVVHRYANARIGAQPVTVLGVDPDRLGDYAFWDDRFSAHSFAELMELIDAPADDGVVPAVVVRGRFATDVVPDEAAVLVGAAEVDVRAVARPRQFPGTHDTNAIIVVAQDNLPGGINVNGYNEVWGHDADAIRAAVAPLTQHPPVTLDTSNALSQSNFLGLSWAFGYLRALAALAGLVAVGALLLYLETRQRTRAASYVLTRRMGLSGGAHLRSLLTELALLTAAALVLGATLALTALATVYDLLDVNPDWPPTPLLAVPTAALAATAAAALLTTVVTTAYAHRAAGRARPAEATTW